MTQKQRNIIKDLKEEVELLKRIIKKWKRAYKLKPKESKCQKNKRITKELERCIKMLNGESYK